MCGRSAGISTLGWWLGLASVTNFIAAMIAGIAVLNHPDYVIEKWHIWLLFVAVTWLAIALNVFGTRLLPVWNQFMRESSFCLLGHTLIKDQFISLSSLLSCP